jgi:hypothetical protein
MKRKRFCLRGSQKKPLGKFDWPATPPYLAATMENIIRIAPAGQRGQKADLTRAAQAHGIRRQERAG